MSIFRALSEDKL